MNRFDYVRAGTVAEAIQAFQADPKARFIAGGTNLVDLMKYDVERPERLIDITRLPLTAIDEHEGGLRIGALATNAAAAYDPRVRERYPVLANAILAGASAQLRNAASTAATSTSARGATISTTRPRPATSASPAPAAPRSAASTASMRSSGRASTASRRTPPTCASRSRRWRPPCR